jgi:adenylate cyclase
MEIERKFLVDPEKWEKEIKPEPKTIIQAYLLRSPEKTIRVRTKGSKGYITIKGPTKGISREEFEYEIPLEDAHEMIRLFADKVIEKKRFEITIGEHTWEIDVFGGKLNGLILAEIELSDEGEAFKRPEWITEEVSTDPNYFNANLIEKG